MGVAVSIMRRVTISLRLNTEMPEWMLKDRLQISMQPHAGIADKTVIEGIDLIWSCDKCNGTGEVRVIHNMTDCGTKICDACDGTGV